MTDEKLVEVVARKMAIVDGYANPDNMIDLAPGVIDNGCTDEVPFWGMFVFQARATLSALEAAGFVVTQDWQPIETAPKDGTQIMVWRKHEQGRAQSSRRGIDFWKNGCWWMSRPAMRPTHWMPLPEPPKETGDA